MYIGIIGISILILLLALYRYKSCMSLISDMHYSNSWKGLFAIIWLFVAGYAFYGYSLIANHAFASDHLLIVVVFFLGSVYVLLVTNLNHKIFAEIAALQKEAKHYTEHLEEEVRARTKELEKLSVTDNLTGLKNQRFFTKNSKKKSTGQTGRAMISSCCSLISTTLSDTTTRMDTLQAIKYCKPSAR